MNEAPIAPGWQALLKLEYGLRGDKTRLISKQQSGPLTLQRGFYPEGDVCHNYLLHPPGGVVGGDQLHINVAMNPDSHSLLTTPGANKFYRAKDNHRALVQQRFSIAAGATLEWLPQQNIFFPGAYADLISDIDIAPEGHYAGWEIHCFGRPSNNETFSSGQVSSQTRVSIGGELRLIERFNTEGMSGIKAVTGLRGLPLQGTFIAAPCNKVEYEKLEQILQADMGDTEACPIGLTLVDDVLVVRALGTRIEPMQARFIRLWSELRQQWLDKPACVPRIWAT